VIEMHTTVVQHVAVIEDALVIDLVDGRTVSVPLAWYPRLLHGQPEERNHWRMIGQGEGIHWPDLDEDINQPIFRSGVHLLTQKRSLG
jgi:hypothetical protein